MKKFLLALSCMFAIYSANAIELTFWMGNHKITPGSTVEFNDITVNVYEDDQYKEVIMKPDLSISTNIYSSSVKITATCTSGQSIQLCAGGTCRGGETVTQEKVTVRPNPNVALGFDYIGEFDLDDEIPVVVTVIEAEDVNESGSRVQFVIEMSEKNASVSEIEVLDELKAVDGGLSYKCDEATDLVVTTLAGVSVFSATVSGEGHIALDKGLYVFTFGGKSGKIYVR